jgi:hypothetical protein
MGTRNYLIEGVSGTGKTTVAEELEHRGYQVVHGDRALAGIGDPSTGKPLTALPPDDIAESPEWKHKHWIWNEDKVRSLVASHDTAITFFCGGSRNLPRFIHLFDEVFVLDVDTESLKRRLQRRPEDEFGGRADEQELILRLRATKEDLPTTGKIIDATKLVAQVVDEILAECGLTDKRAE